MTEPDLDLLTLWTPHTHLATELYTTPRLLLDSPVPGSGKTTTLDHLKRLCVHPVQMASVSSPALLVRMLDAGMRTILIDEADRSLNPDKEGVGDLLAVLNTGYKRGATRPVLVPAKNGSGWIPAEMSTFAPVAIAGNNPNLPDDTRERIIRVLLLPDVDGTVEESDWELIEDDAAILANRIVEWADSVRDWVKIARPPLPDSVKGRARERWSPLIRVAAAAGGRWPAAAERLALQDVERIELEREEGIVQQKPAVVLLRHLGEKWPETTAFRPTGEIIATLVRDHPETWGPASPFGKTLTAQRLGRMLVTSYNVHSDRPDGHGQRGYLRASLAKAWRGLGITPTGDDDDAEDSGQTGASGASGITGAISRSPSPPGPPGETGASGAGGATGAADEAQHCRVCDEPILLRNGRTVCAKTDQAHREARDRAA